MIAEEYIKMYEFENHYWWYRGLHELVRFYVTRVGKEAEEAEEKLKENHGNPGGDVTLKIFDAGCGTGRMLELLEKFGTVEGIDYSPEAVALCRKRGLRRVETGDLNAWNSSPNAYDVIISNDVICTSGIDDDLAVLEKFFTGLKPGGYLILNLPAFRLLRRMHDIAVSGKRRYRKRKTVRTLAKMGFQISRANYRLPALFVFILFQKYIIELFSKNKTVTSDLKPLPSFINRLLLVMNRVENKLFTAGVPFLFGSSLFIVCKKPGQAGMKA
ncbi:MAG: class I SAM-dependent methyltransferase [Acidobacteria bacterium]|jgi:SAM-dependent methyltransferase|nr:class I SAM-dependent methyltransferase [Acidobacteriota bacterium]